MNLDNILKTLLGKGYFPKELPPVFRSDSFGLQSKKIISEWKSLKVFSTRIVKRKGKKRFRGNFNYVVKDTESEPISKPKKGYERRFIHVTHPIPQALLSNEIAMNFDKISKWLLKQKNSVDTLRVSIEYDRGVKEIEFGMHNVKKNFIESSFDWAVKTDITRFYPSIYTHSIAWAAYGKKKVKNNRRNYSGSLADRLDQLVRNCNRNQTIGIPIGPETSRIIAEIISSKIDTIFNTYQPLVDLKNVDRLQDDWLVGAKSLEQAESILSSITKSYRIYGLEINGSKTSILHIMQSSKKSWKSDLSSYLNNRNRNLQGPVLAEFLDMSESLQLENLQESITSYTISILERTDIKQRDVPIVESYLIKASIISPIAMSKICTMLINLQFYTNKISKSRIKERFIYLIDGYIDKGYSYELIWALYALRGLKIPFSMPKLSEEMNQHQGSIVPLLLLDMKDKGIFRGVLPISFWEDQISTKQVLENCTWLLGYEGIRHGWLSDKNSVMDRAFFKVLIDNNVSFYDETKNVVNVKAKRRELILAHRRSKEKSRALLSALRGVGTPSIQQLTQGLRMPWDEYD